MKVMVSVYDVQAQVFGTPFFVRSANEGVRSFIDEVNRADDSNMLYKHPMDFSLYQLAVFNDVTGELEDCDKRKLFDGLGAQAKAAAKVE